MAKKCNKIDVSSSSCGICLCPQTLTLRPWLISDIAHAAGGGKLHATLLTLVLLASFYCFCRWSMHPLCGTILQVFLCQRTWIFNFFVTKLLHMHLRGCRWSNNGTTTLPSICIISCFYHLTPEILCSLAQIGKLQKYKRSCSKFFKSLLSLPCKRVSVSPLFQKTVI